VKLFHRGVGEDLSSLIPKLPCRCTRNPPPKHW